MNIKERIEFLSTRNNTFKRALRISFHSFEEMAALQQEQRYKIPSRNKLGIKGTDIDDWIFTFNIGNIMHLKTMGFDGLEVKLPEGNLLNFSKNETIITAQTNESRIISPMIQ